MKTLIQSLQTQLDQIAVLPHDPRIVFMSGASGAGKTHLVAACEATFIHPQLQYVHFDQIGVPSLEVMQDEFGSTEQWQAAMTLEWVRRFKEDYVDTQLFIFEGQYNFEFARKACQQWAIQHYQLVLVTVPAAVKMERLIYLRHQPELANENMLNWANFLDGQAQTLGATIIDTSTESTEKAVKQILEIAFKLITLQ